MTTMQKKLVFSGHESFQCRQLWLKKGYDFIRSGKSFNDEDAVVILGVGKNMVASIRFWMKAFNLLSSDDKLSIFANKLLADDGYDPYLEDEASLWLLHFQLVNSGFSSTYSIVFNELRREKIEFTRENFVAYIKRKSEIEKSFQVNEKTLHEDFSVLTKMYLRSDGQSKDKEDSFSGLLTELDLVKSISKGKEEIFVIENGERPEIPDEVILYAMLNSGALDLSINLNNIEQDYNSIGAVFALSRSGILAKIDSIASKHRFIVYNDHAGVKEIQFKKKPSALSILDKYYAN
jgi:hypothetical protein